jgi:uncharacterized phiE125 gp8 family phage protein
MTVVVSTAPATEPVTITEAKLHLKVDGTDDDNLITALIKAARMQAENETRRALITQTIDVYLDAFADEILLPPITAVTAITYTDTAGATQTLASNQYAVDIYSEPARVVPAYDVTWPETREQNNAVKIRCTAGWANAAAVPEAIKSWMLLQIGHWYANREAAGARLDPLPFIECLLDPYRVQRAF